MTTVPSPTPFALGDDENVTVGIAPGTDAAGNATTEPFDAGSVVATLSDGTELSAVVSADQTSVLITALGPITALGQNDVLTVVGDVGGRSVKGVFPINLEAGPPQSVAFTPGTPQANAAGSTSTGTTAGTGTSTSTGPVDAATSATADPTSTGVTGTSQITVETLSTGEVTYSVDPSSTAPGADVSATGVVSATGEGSVDVDIAVEADDAHNVSSATVTVDFTA
jgi:hypothetical protein